MGDFAFLFERLHTVSARCLVAVTGGCVPAQNVLGYGVVTAAEILFRTPFSGTASLF